MKRDTTLSTIRRITRGVALAFGLCVAGAPGWAGFLQLTDNFHMVREGQLYRSAQMSGDHLKEAIERYHIRTVINLRGEHVSDPWYDQEIETTRSAGAIHADLALSARRELTEDERQRLLVLLRDAPRPILIHCRSGADRTGLAAALDQYLVAKVPASDAARQLSFRYGHFPYFNRTAAMDRVFEREVASGD